MSALAGLLHEEGRCPHDRVLRAGRARYICARQRYFGRGCQLMAIRDDIASSSTFKYGHISPSHGRSFTHKVEHLIEGAMSGGGGGDYTNRSSNLAARKPEDMSSVGWAGYVIEGNCQGDRALAPDRRHLFEGGNVTSGRDQSTAGGANAADR